MSHLYKLNKNSDIFVRMGKGLNILPYYALTGFTSKMCVSMQRVADKNCMATKAFGQIKEQDFSVCAR